METTWHETPRRGFLRPLREWRTYLETLDLLLDFPFAVAWFTLFTTLVTTGVSLLITLVGLPILTLTFLAARWIAWFERRRAEAMLGLAIEDPRRHSGAGRSFFQRLVAPFRDRMTWKEL